MRPESFPKLLQKVYNTRDEELDCEGFFKSIPQYVETEIAGGRAEQQSPDVKHHLDQCADCYDLYLTLHDVVLLEHQQTNSELAYFQRI